MYTSDYVPRVFIVEEDNGVLSIMLNADMQTYPLAAVYLQIYSEIETQLEIYNRIKRKNLTLLEFEKDFMKKIPDSINYFNISRQKRNQIAHNNFNDILIGDRDMKALAMSFYILFLACNPGHTFDRGPIVIIK